MWPQASNFTSVGLGFTICKEQVVIPLRVTRKIINTEWDMPSLIMTAGLQKCQLFIISYYFFPSPSSSPPPQNSSPSWFKKKKKKRKEGFFFLNDQNPYSDFSSFLWAYHVPPVSGSQHLLFPLPKTLFHASSPNQGLLTLSSGVKNPFLTACLSCPDILPQSMESLWFDSITSSTGW